MPLELPNNRPVCNSLQFSNIVLVLAALDTLVRVLFLA